MPRAKNKAPEFDAEEMKILHSVEKGEWKSVNNLREEKKAVMAAADHFMKKDARINIRVSSYDLDRIKRIAAIEGLSYQTLIASILHKFAASRF